MKIAFFPGCMVDMFYPEVGIAAVTVLERLGCKVEMPQEAICCGQMLINTGYPEEMIPVAKTIIDAYSTPEYEDKIIVSLSGSCMNAIVNDYPLLFDEASEYGQKLARLRSRFYEFTQFITDYLGVSDVGAFFDHSVTYHKSCHVTRLLGITEPPITLLQNVAGLELIEMEHADRCCGFGGTFSIKEPEISAAIVEEKCRTILATGAEVVCGADMSCLLNIKGALARMRDRGELDRDIRVMHIAEILNA